MPQRDELYDAGHPEAIVTCADNRAAVDVVADAARRGVHVMKEKPMAVHVGTGRADVYHGSPRRHSPHDQLAYQLATGDSPRQTVRGRGANW